MSEQILLIEDDARLAEMVADYLGESGFAVTIAGTGAGGLAQQKSRSFDAVILDLMLPDMDGLEVCRTLRATDGTTEFRWEDIDADALHPAAHKRVQAAHPDAIPTGVNVGAWVFVPQGAQTQVHYRLCSDPGGKIPEWAGHMAAKIALPTNVADIIERAQGKR